MSFISYYTRLNKELKLLDNFNLWDIQNINYTSSILCADGSKIDEHSWYNLLRKTTNSEISILNSDIPQFIICDNKSYKQHKLSTETLARLIYCSVVHCPPKVLFVRFRNIQRYEFVRSSNNRPKIVPDTVITECLYSPYHLRAFFNFVQNFQFIENICKLYGIKFYWTSSCYYIRSLSKKQLKEYLNTNCFFVKPGPKYHQKVAKKFYKILKTIP